MYLGHWPVNYPLIDDALERLTREGRVSSDGDLVTITASGLRALENEEQRNREYLDRGLSKDACAKYSLLGNIGLSLLEFAVGFLSGSIGLIADAIHTAIDIGASALTWFGIRVEREAEAACAGGIILCGIGLFIAWESIGRIFDPEPIRFGLIALITIGINIGVNTFFSYYKFYVGGRTRSISLVADAYSPSSCGEEGRLLLPVFQVNIPAFRGMGSHSPLGPEVKHKRPDSPFCPDRFMSRRGAGTL